jgi:two-component system KDP operon response regulator KdpE
MAELVARVHTALRHRLQEQGAAPVLQCGRITIDLMNRVVRTGSAEIKLSPTEYDLLQLFAAHPGKVLTHEFILRNVWGGDKINDVQYLRVYVRTLRQKLEAGADQPQLIETETGVGYRLVCPL